MTNLKQLAFKFLLLIPILVCLNFVYKKYFFENDIQTHSPILNKVRRAVSGKNEIIYVGESSNFTFREDDFDKRSISDFLGEYYPSKKWTPSLNKQAMPEFIMSCSEIFLKIQP